MNGRIDSIHRYPIKSLPGEALSSTPVTRTRGLEDDRRFALLLPGTRFDPDDGMPLPKTRFVTTMRTAETALLSLRYDERSTRVEIAARGEPLAAGHLTVEADRRMVARALGRVLRPDDPDGLTLVEAPGMRFTDASIVSAGMMNTLTLINLETLREVEARLGRPLDPRRFRANIVVDGLPAWSEFDWIGRSVDFAEAGFHAVSRVRRCAAVDVDPRTARRDGSFWVAMVRAYGHVDFGVHLSVRVGGDISVGDPLAAEIPGPVELPA